MDILKIIAFILVIFIGLITLITVTITPISITDCNALGTNTNRQTKWEFWGGGSNNCLIYVNNQWIPTDKWINNSGK